VQAIIDMVDDFVASGDIDATMANSLKSKLEAALASLERGNENSARGQLNAFINQVEAQRGKKISDAAADALISAAQAVLDGLESANPAEFVGTPQAVLDTPVPTVPGGVPQAGGQKGPPRGRPGR
jgi:hypothetical protein